MSQAFVILGMHRSGTSMLASIIQALGVFIGDELLPAGVGNSYGYFENVQFIGLNDLILMACGGSWENPPPLEKLLEVESKFKDSIIAVIRANERSKWGWKDPRTAITIWLYHPHLENPSYLYIKRDPFAVAQSLQRRDGSSIEKGLYLAEKYRVSIERFLETVSSPFIELRYEDFLKDPVLQVKKVSDFVGEFNINYEEVAKLVKKRGENGG